MRVINKKEFLSLPSGIVYCYAREGQPCWDEIFIKGETCEQSFQPEKDPVDWYETELNKYENSGSHEFFDRFEEMKHGSVSYPLEICLHRNGLYEDKDLFLVFEDADLKTLIDALKEAIAYEGGNKV